MWEIKGWKMNFVACFLTWGGSYKRTKKELGSANGGVGVGVDLGVE